MKPHTPPPLDAPENVWRAHIADQLASIHQCFEDRMEATDARVETHHAENKQRWEGVLNAIGEVKAMAQPAFAWTSGEEKQREKDALIEAGKQLERERWLGWLHRAQAFVNEIWQWVGKPAAGAALLYLTHRAGIW